MEGEDLADLVKEPGFEHFIPDYKKIKNSVDAFKLDTQKPFEADGSRGVWYHGAPGTGKSHAARAKSVLLFDEDPFIMTGGKWLDGYKGQKVIIIEDLDKQTCYQIAHSLKLWGDKYGVTAEVKGATIPLMHQLLFVTSNYTIQELYAPDSERHTTDQCKKQDELIEAIK